MHSVPQLEEGAKVREEQFLLPVLANHRQQLLVNSLLVRLALVIWLVGLLLLGKHVTIGRFLSLSLLLDLKILIIDVVGYLNARDVQLGAGHDYELLVHAAQWALVDGEGTVDKEKTRGKLFKEDDTLSSVTASQNDENLAGLETWRNHTW